MQRLDADAFNHAHGVVLGQREAGAKTSEIPLFTTLLDRIEITGAVITADALHAQREHARYLARHGAHYVITVKGNQPGLYAQFAVLPWRDMPVAYTCYAVTSLTITQAGHAELAAITRVGTR